MLWPFLVVPAVAIGLIQLGAMSVWVTVLSLALKVLLMLAVVVFLLFLRSRYGRR